MIRYVSVFTWWVKDEKKREWLNQFLGFCLVGVSMTLLTVVLYYICFDIFDFPLKITYASVSIVMIFLSYMLNNYMVFKQEFSYPKMFSYYGVYLSGMLIGMVLLHFMERMLPFSKTILSVMTIPVTMIWNFILSSYILKSERLSSKTVA